MLPLQTPRLLLRELQKSDFEAIHAYASDLETVEFVEWGPNTLKDTGKFLETQIANQTKKPRKEAVFAVTLKDSGELIGTCGVTLKEDHADFGYAFNKRYWGNGYATEAAHRLLQWAEEAWGVTHFRATCDVLNEASRKVIEKCGLILVKRIDKDVQIRGRWRDTYVFEK